MADFTSKLQQLSVRGTPVGAEELIERIEAELAGDPLVVVTKRREGVFMTNTDQPAKTQAPGPGRGLAWALAAFAAVLTVGGLYLAFSGDDGQVVDQTTVPTATTGVSPATTAASTLPYLRGLPGSRGGPAGQYGWIGARLGSTGGMHHVIDMGDNGGFRQTQLVFAVENECFGAGGDPIPVNVAGLDGLYVEPYEDPSVRFWPRLYVEPNDPQGDTTGAFALPIGDRTLCVYLTWDPATTEEELAASRQVVESIRGEPYGEDGIQINLTLPAGWDTG